MANFEQTLFHALENGERVVLATIVSQIGSTPRTAGTKMIIRRDGGIVGTIGGGLAEAEIITMAGRVFETDMPVLRRFDMTSALADGMDMICGGRIDVLVEPVHASPENRRIFETLATALQTGQKAALLAAIGKAGELPEKIGRCVILEDGSTQGPLSLTDGLAKDRPAIVRNERNPVILSHATGRFLVEPYFVSGTVFLFGAGHVSADVAKLAKSVDFRVVVLDDRKEFANRARFETADDVCVLTSFDHAFDTLDIDRDSHIVIVTRGHLHDKTVLTQALKTKAGYVGMIGSRKKRDAIYLSLLNNGFTNDDLKRVHSPIGLAIGAQTPAEIAVSIVAELIAVRAGKPVKN